MTGVANPVALGVEDGKANKSAVAPVLALMAASERVARPMLRSLSIVDVYRLSAEVIGAVGAATSRAGSSSENDGVKPEDVSFTFDNSENNDRSSGFRSAQMSDSSDAVPLGEAYAGAEAMMPSGSDSVSFVGCDGPALLLLAALVDPAGFLPALFAWIYSHSKPRFSHRSQVGLRPEHLTFEAAHASQEFLKPLEVPSDVLRRFGVEGAAMGEAERVGGAAAMLCNGKSCEHVSSPSSKRNAQLHPTTHRTVFLSSWGHADPPRVAADWPPRTSPPSPPTWVGGHQVSRISCTNG